MTQRQAYGLTELEYQVMLGRADGRCEVCRTAPHRNIDHDRVTRKCRGLVCVTCNARLRAVDDGTREPTPDEARYLAFEQVGRHGATPLRSLRIPKDIWDASVAKAKSEGTTLTALITAELRRYNAEH